MEFCNPQEKAVGVGESLGEDFRIKIKRFYSLRKTIIRRYSDEDLAAFLCRIYEHGKNCSDTTNCQFCNFKMCKGQEYVKAWLSKETGSGQDGFDTFNDFPVL